MAGRKLVLTGVNFTDLSAPKLIDTDPLEVYGSLFLADPTHPSGAWAAGVPTNGQVVPNVLRDLASELVGGVPSAVDGVVSVLNLSGTRGKIERSTENGVHVIYANGDATNAGASSATAAAFVVTLPDAIKTYLLANWDHALFVSVWFDVTRVSPAVNTNVVVSLNNLSSASSNYKTLFVYNALQPASRLGARFAAWSTGGNGPRIENMGVSGHTGTVPASIAGMEAMAFTIGERGAINSAGNGRISVPSGIFHRCYVEDLTVSGRTYEEVDALDFALYTTEVLTSGGRYYNDAFVTDPATLP